MNSSSTQDRARVVLVRLPNPYLSLCTPPVGIGYLLKSIAALDQIEPVFLDCQLEGIQEQQLVESLAASRPLAVGFQVYSIDYPVLRGLLPALRQALPRATLIAGGPHPSGLPEETLTENPSLDFVIRGEGEDALRRLLESRLAGDPPEELASIPNLAYRHHGRVVQNDVVAVDVEALGAPAWELIRPDRYPGTQFGTLHRKSRVVPLLTSRGCPYPCAYCAGHLLTGKKIRTRSSQSIVDEIQWLQQTYGFEEFIIQDENFTFHREHVFALADEIQRRGVRCAFSFANGLRLDRLDEAVVRRLREIGGYMAQFGIESGSTATLQRMKKNWDLDQVVEKVQLLRSHGMYVLGAFILGYRDETMADIEKTIDFAIRCGVDVAFFGNYSPLPGTEDFSILVERGDIDMATVNWADLCCFQKLYYHPEQVSADELRRALRRAYFRFYLRPRPMVHLLGRLRHPLAVKVLAQRALELVAGVWSRRSALPDSHQPSAR